MLAGRRRRFAAKDKSAPGSDEKFITKSFHVACAGRLREANDGNYIAQMFLKDLKNGFPLFVRTVQAIMIVTKKISQRRDRKRFGNLDYSAVSREEQ